MKIKVKLLGHLRKYRKSEQEIQEVELEANSDLVDLFAAVGVPDKEFEFTLLLVNGQPVQKDHKLQEGDIVSLVTPADGG